MTDTNEQIRVRFAPSPTGFLHVGGARTALFNWLYARRHGGVFVLRIEDTDRARSSEEMTEVILDGMRWLGLDWDEGPVHQADGVERHRAAADRLLAEGKAYRCFATPEELRKWREEGGEDFRLTRDKLELPEEEADRRVAEGEPYTVRFRVPEGSTEWDDAVHGKTVFQNDDIDDFIVLRSDRTPVYNLAAVADDVEMRISHVIRGDDHISNTPRQIMLYRALGAEVPTFAHVPMILGPDGRRLSKRHGATAVGDYAAEGILPEALVNFLALLGWSPGEDREVMTIEEMMALFSLERINKKSAIFDPEKLDWMNGQHLSRQPAERIVPLVARKLVDSGTLSEAEVAENQEWLVTLVEMFKVRSRRADEIARHAQLFLADEVAYDPIAVQKHWKDPADVAKRLDAVSATLRNLGAWEPAMIEQALRATAERLNTGFGKIVHPLRLAVTGQSSSPGIDQVLFMTGRERTLKRLKVARKSLVGTKG